MLQAVHADVQPRGDPQGRWRRQCRRQEAVVLDSPVRHLPEKLRQPEVPAHTRRGGRAVLHSLRQSQLVFVGLSASLTLKIESNRESNRLDQ